MNGERQMRTQIGKYSVMNYINDTSYDVYLGKRERKPTYSVLHRGLKSNTFHNTGKVIIGSKYSVSHKPVMDNDAIALQVALLQYEKERQYYWSDMALQVMFVLVCLYVAVSVVIWGSV
jgi:hypothetical protein